ncbi:hypothetical protein PIB30_058839 [Stylosanthes scabra]|uniref:Pentatricopeptide repeat-containing protein n=1 Tax=Stylosanthes scabra TaxID=79078 RepID=A0ABU6WM56_9FABA|nr:hypothetical protein [Stylosanthes scabra]
MLENRKRVGRYLKKCQGRAVCQMITYTCLIDGFCKSNRIDLASWLVGKMNRDAVRPDVVTYTVLIAWYRKHGLLDQAHNLYNEMMAKGILPDDRICQVLI